MTGDAAGRTLRTAAAVVALALVAIATFVPMGGNDYWLQARVGQMIVEQHQWPTTLLFPFTAAAGQHFNLHESLPSVLLYALDRTVGHDGLLFVHGVLGLLMFGLLWAAAARLSHRPDLGLALAALGMAGMNYRFYLRPELPAVFMMLGLLFTCLRVRDGAAPRALLWALPLQWLWANSHGSFILGPALAGLFAFGEGVDEALRRGTPADALRRARPFLLLAVALLAVSVLNPLGPRLLLFPFELASSGATRAYVGEWKSTFFSQFTQDRAFWLLAATAGVGAGVAVWRRRALRASDVLLLLVFTGLAATRVRHGVWLAVVVPMVSAGLLRRPATAGPKAPERPLLAATLALCGAGLVAVYTHGNAYHAYPYETPTHDFSPRMVELLARPELQGPVFVSFELGSELIYRAWPRLKPSIDSRIDSYGDAYFLMHEALARDEAQLLAFLQRFDVRTMLLTRQDFDLVRRHQGLLDRGWRMEFSDQKMVLLRLKAP